MRAPDKFLACLLALPLTFSVELWAQEYSEQLLQKLTDTTQSWSSASFERQTALVQLFETDMLRSDYHYYYYHQHHHLTRRGPRGGGKASGRVSRLAVAASSLFKSFSSSCHYPPCLTAGMKKISCGNIQVPKLFAISRSKDSLRHRPVSFSWLGRHERAIMSERGTFAEALLTRQGLLRCSAGRCASEFSHPQHAGRYLCFSTGVSVFRTRLHVP